MASPFLHKHQNKDIRRSIHLPTLVTKDKYKDESDYCQICRLKNKRRLAEFFCTNCAMPMCPGCKETHVTTRVTADHVIVQKKEQDVNQHTCVVHRFANVQYFCDTCLQLVCVNCTMIEHKNHEIMGIHEKAHQSRGEMEDILRDLDQKVARYEIEMGKVDQVEKNIELNRDEMRAEITQRVIQLQQALKQQGDDMIRQLDRYLDEKSANISKQKEVIEKRYDEVLHTRRGIDIKVAGMSDEEVIERNINLQKDILKLQNPISVDTHEYRYLKFNSTNDGVLGKMEESTDPAVITARLSSRAVVVGGKEYIAVPPIQPIKVESGKSSIPVKKNNVTKKKAEKPRQDENDEDNASEPARINPSRLEEMNTSITLPRSGPGEFRTVSRATRYLYEKHGRAPNLKIVHRFKTFNYLQTPSGLAVLPNGKYVIADAANYGVLLCDKSGRWQQRICQEDVAFPTGVVVNREGEIAIATHKYIKIYRQDGIKVRQFSAPVTTITALAMDDYGHYVVMDQSNRQLIVFDEDGLELRTIIPVNIGSMRPDNFNLALGGDHIALSYQPSDMGGLVKLYNYRGDELKSCELPNPCKGIQMDRFGNMIVSCGLLLYIPAKGHEIMELSCADKKGKNFQLTSRSVAFTPQGLICTIHGNKVTQRSELVTLHLG